MKFRCRECGQNSRFYGARKTPTKSELASFVEKRRRYSCEDCGALNDVVLSAAMWAKVDQQSEESAPRRRVEKISGLEPERTPRPGRVFKKAAKKAAKKTLPKKVTGRVMWALKKKVSRKASKKKS